MTAFESVYMSTLEHRKLMAELKANRAMIAFGDALQTENEVYDNIKAEIYDS